MDITFAQDSFENGDLNVFNRMNHSFPAPLGVWIMIQVQHDPKKFRIGTYLYNRDLIDDSGEISVGGTILRTNAKVRIGHNFYGLIKGVKYYNTY